MSDDLVAWLRARLDEVERVAGPLVERPWTWLADEVPADMIEHVDLNDPAFVLADVAAKRRIIDEHQSIDQRGPWHEGTGYETETVCSICVYIGDDEDGGGNQFRYLEHAEWPCITVRLLALPFAGRPGYRPEWSPE